MTHVTIGGLIQRSAEDDKKEISNIVDRQNSRH
jgi:hypothetical protein